MGEIKIIQWGQASDGEKKNILLRSQADLKSFEPVVKKWIEIVRQKGDAGIREYINTFDLMPKGRPLRVLPEEIVGSFKRINPDLLAQMRQQIALSMKFHAAFSDAIQKEMSVEQLPGVTVGFRKVPVESAGLYVPAGKAPLPTVAQILTVAARAAGVPRIVVCFPPTEQVAEDTIVVAASLAGADEIYRVGGIAAIAALAYGTESIKSVVKIAGPGNSYVQAAKLQVVDKVGIDMFSGPSEAILIGDESANPAYLAADILARCEHGSDSAGVLLTTSMRLAESVKKEVARQAPLLKRQEYIQDALNRYSAIIVLESEEALVTLVNIYKPEHLEIQTAEPEQLFTQIKNAGSTFIGAYAPVAVGDYASGTNHCLPTGFATAFSSAVSPETFLKTLQYQSLTKEGLRQLMPIVQTIADAEGLGAHRRSVEIRFED